MQDAPSLAAVTFARQQQPPFSSARQLGLTSCTHRLSGGPLKQESAPALERRIKHYVVPDLLILDEIGYLPADTRSADLLYNIISRRHEKKATVITTNLAFKEWGTVFPGAACVAALIDRFVQHCHVLDVVGDSHRVKDAEKHRRTSRRRRQTPSS